MVKMLKLDPKFFKKIVSIWLFSNENICLSLTLNFKLNSEKRWNGAVDLINKNGIFFR